MCHVTNTPGSIEHFAACPMVFADVCYFECRSDLGDDVGESH